MYQSPALDHCVAIRTSIQKGLRVYLPQRYCINWAHKQKMFVEKLTVYFIHILNNSMENVIISSITHDLDFQNHF
jgi:hypothetical protein